MQFQVKDRVIQQYKTVLGVQGDSGVCEVAPRFALISQPNEISSPQTVKLPGSRAET